MRIAELLEGLDSLKSKAQSFKDENSLDFNDESQLQAAIRKLAKPYGLNATVSSYAKNAEIIWVGISPLSAASINDDKMVKDCQELVSDVESLVRQHGGYVKHTRSVNEFYIYTKEKPE